MDHRMRSKLAIARQVIALGEQMNVDLAEHRRKRIDVIEFASGRRRSTHAADSGTAPCGREVSRQRDRRGGLGGLGRNFASREFDDRNILYARQHRPDGYSGRRLVHSEK